MEASTIIKRMLAGNKIFVPAYQRAYSWEMDKHVNVFLTDLEDYNKSQTKTPYYFGHFLFEEKTEDTFGVIDGQQRLTTIVIFLSALFRKLASIRSLTESEEVAKEDMICRQSTHRFETVDYDNQLFKDYVIEKSKENKNCETSSAKRIIDAYDFFVQHLSYKNEPYLTKMLATIQNASCTTHPVKDEMEAIQMFIFQNNRGKKPSNLEIIKAQFMFNIHLFGGAEKDSLIETVKNRFEKIYKSISSIEHKIDEDDVLTYTLRVSFNSLSESGIEKINRQISENNPIPFIKSFTQALANSFEYLVIFFGEDEQKNTEIHSLISLGGISLAIPFIIKAYLFGLPKHEIGKLCTSLESIIVRERLTGTKADVISRLNDVYQNFTKETPSINSILARIEYLKTVQSESYYWAHWNNAALERSIQGWIYPPIARYILWKYENNLEEQGKSGYAISRFDKIVSPELEHIAPQTPTNGEPVAAGYCEYDEEFKNEYVNCLGNYLLISKSHNCSIGNKPFADKRNSYNQLAQQRQVQEMTKEKEVWTKELINKRKSIIVDFILKNF